VISHIEKPTFLAVQCVMVQFLIECVVIAAFVHGINQYW
jgi:hypothetical protein